MEQPPDPGGESCRIADRVLADFPRVVRGSSLLKGTGQVGSDETRAAPVSGWTKEAAPLTLLVGVKLLSDTLFGQSRQAVDPTLFDRLKQV